MNRLWLAAALVGQEATSGGDPPTETTAEFESALGELLQRARDVRADPSTLPDFTQFVALEYIGPIAINLLVAGIIFLIGRWVARALTRVVGRVAGQAKLDETLVKFLQNIVYSLLMVVVIMAALDRLGVPTSSFAAILAAGGFAIGMALQGSLGNFAAGVMLIVFKPFKVGDYVEAGGSAGVVEEIRIFNTLMRTGDNVQIIVPNGSITSDTVTNYSAKSTRRIDLVMGCGYDDDLRAVKKLLKSILNADERVLAEPEPVVVVGELADSSVNFLVRPWVKTEDYWATRWDLTEAIKLGFDERGFSIPYPQQDVHVQKDATQDVKASDR